MHAWNFLIRSAIETISSNCEKKLYSTKFTFERITNFIVTMHLYRKMKFSIVEKLRRIRKFHFYWGVFCHLIFKYKKVIHKTHKLITSTAKFISYSIQDFEMKKKNLNVERLSFWASTLNFKTRIWMIRCFFFTISLIVFRNIFYQWRCQAWQAIYWHKSIHMLPFIKFMM